MLREAHIMHGVSERFWPRSFGAEAASLIIIMAFMARVPRVVLRLCIFIPLVVLVAHLGF
jgi:hypothetical protein